LMARAAEGRHLERIAFDEEHMECEFVPQVLGRQYALRGSRRTRMLNPFGFVIVRRG
jgi:hypothetical protein